MAADEGASSKEILFEACRRDNRDLLTTTLSHIGQPSTIAQFINTSTDALGCGALHVAAQYGSLTVLDLILDQEGVEIDGVEPREGDTPLHSAVRYTNKLDEQEWEQGQEVVDMLVDAGCDPRIRNKAKLRPIDLVDPRNKELRGFLQKAEFAMVAGNDVVDEDDEEAGGAGSGSESD